MPSENERLAELEALFDLRWNADRRAIQRWQAEQPEERQLTWPDHADLCVWLLGRVEELERERDEAEMRAEQLFYDRHALLSAKTTEGLSAAEWQMRTATGEQRVKELKRENRRLASELKAALAAEEESHGG